MVDRGRLFDVPDLPLDSGQGAIRGGVLGFSAKCGAYSGIYRVAGIKKTGIKARIHRLEKNSAWQESKTSGAKEHV